MTIKKHGLAVWQGGIKDGVGSISTESGALSNYPYGFGSRFEEKKVSNPEELIGAAHASCFKMALSRILTQAGFTPKELRTSAEVSLDKVDDRFSITRVKLTLDAEIPGINQKTFEELSAKAKAGCPVSKLLKADILLEAVLHVGGNLVDKQHTMPDRVIKILLQTTIPDTADDWSIARFSRLAAFLRGERSPNDLPVFEVTIRDRDPIGKSDFVLASFDASDFDEMWLFAVDVGNGLTTDDCEGITRFRQTGRGLLVIRDHMDLGSFVCTLGGVGKAHYFHS